MRTKTNPRAPLALLPPPPSSLADSKPLPTQPMSGRIRLNDSSSGRIRLNDNSAPSAFRRAFSKLLRSRRPADLKRVALSSFRLQGLPLKIRPAFVVLTGLTLVVLSVLGFHPTLAGRISPPVPFSDKLLHFVSCLRLFEGGGLTRRGAGVLLPRERAVLWDLERGRGCAEGVVLAMVGRGDQWSCLRRRYVCCFSPERLGADRSIAVGSIGSEFVQGLLPYKSFQWGDVLVGSLSHPLVFPADVGNRAGQPPRHRTRHLPRALRLPLPPPLAGTPQDLPTHHPFRCGRGRE